AGDLGLGEVLDPRGGVDLGLGEDLLGTGPADAVDVRQRGHDALLARQVDTWDSSHAYPCLCVWVGLAVQVTSTRPCRRMTLHLTHMGLTHALTFMLLLSYFR